MGISLTVTAKGQVTLRKEVLEHLGVQPGDKLEIDLLPQGRMTVRAKPGRPITSTFGMLSRPGTRALSIEEMNAVIAEGWSGRK